MKPKITKEIVLHNRVKIPSLGFRITGTTPQTCYNQTKQALENGWRYLSIGKDAECRKKIGQAIFDSGIPRRELFLSAYCENVEDQESALKKADASLKNMQLDYFDMLLYGWPKKEINTHAIQSTWKAAEELYKQGHTHVIGIRCFSSKMIETILEISEIAPMVHQYPQYPGYPNQEATTSSKEHGMQSEAYIPEEKIDLPKRKELEILAQKYQVSPDVLCVRYLLQKHSIALWQDPAFQPDRAFSFSILEEDMQFLDVLHLDR